MLAYNMMGQHYPKTPSSGKPLILQYLLQKVSLNALTFFLVDLILSVIFLSGQMWSVLKMKNEIYLNKEKKQNWLIAAHTNKGVLPPQLDLKKKRKKPTHHQYSSAKQSSHCILITFL